MLKKKEDESDNYVIGESWLFFSFLFRYSESERARMRKLSGDTYYVHISHSCDTVRKSVPIKPYPVADHLYLQLSSHCGCADQTIVCEIKASKLGLKLFSM